MRNVIVLGLLVLFSASCWAQDKVFDWVRARTNSHNSTPLIIMRDVSTGRAMTAAICT